MTATLLISLLVTLGALLVPSCRRCILHVQELGAMSVPREPKETINFADQYYAYYRTVFPEVRSFAHFTALLLGMTAELPRKTAPALARTVGVDYALALHHLLTPSSWERG
jgi:hypothetical protein